ncbi:ashwin [Latimeria chalumnae]|uniref:Ashwin n=1 Tax=Latimeria chalumnae TaxID=7897 RepID=H3AWY4_LATCH|nr:PREDICTED: ashwin [Latimeria chalumnae]|eukprot:XP_005998074.1 PREDICTED: ashwin [Latimeria chalumnae]
MAGKREARECGDNKSKLESDFLLHPELLSRDFVLLTLQEKKIPIENEQVVDKDGLLDLYVQHVIPLPQRELPKSRWGRMMEKRREQQVGLFVQTKSLATDGSRKRPLIVFDGSSTSTSIKLKKNENGTADRLKPPPSGNTTNAIRRLSSLSSNSSSNSIIASPPRDTTVRKEETKPNRTPVNNNNNSSSTTVHLKSLPPSTSSSGTSIVKLKRAAPKGETEMGDLKPTEAKKKIQHVTWP